MREIYVQIRQSVKPSFRWSSSRVRNLPARLFFLALSMVFLSVSVGVNSKTFLLNKSFSYSFLGMTIKSSLSASFLGIVTVFIT